MLTRTRVVITTMEMGLVMVMEERKRNTKKSIVIMMNTIIINGTGMIKTGEKMMIIKRF